ncbi:MAG: O-antigen ligase family protein [Tardiphaga sp.]
MTAGALASLRLHIWPLPAWLLAVMLIVGTTVIGSALGSASRPLFVVGCAALGWYAWRQSPGAHLQAMLVLFAFAPFVRRIVDLGAGFDSAGLMLVGPMLAIMAPAPRLLKMLESRSRVSREMVPILIVGACVVYAAALAIMQADWMNAASGSLKWIAPLVYAAVLIDADDRDELLRAATSAFLVILPIIGAYGIFQYINPPNWDIYWMQYASITSAGYPVPYGVRTYSTMNGPGSFATFVAIGLVIVCFSRLPSMLLLLTGPAAFALLLSSYRTAWLSLAIGILFAMLFGPTRRKAAVILAGIVVVVALAATLTPFGDVIADRVATLGEGSKDGSAQERLDEFVTLWNQWDSSVIGTGFTSGDVGSAGTMPIDGMIVACWVAMGIVVGMICLTGLGLAILNPLLTAWHERSREAIIVGALACGALVQLPLANITSGENGFMFWTFAVLATPRLLAAPDSRI